MSTLWQDLRFGARLLRRNPLSTALALLILTLGIGANTAVFSLVSGVLIRPLPFPQPDRLLVVSDTSPRRGISRFASAPANFADWQRLNRCFSTLAAFNPDRFSLTGGGRPIAVDGAAVSGDFFNTLGVAPYAGRFFVAADDRPGAEPVAVLAFDLWRSYFGADPNLIGRPILIDGHSRTLVGVAPVQFTFPARAALWLPLALDYAKSGRGGHFLSVLGRLRPGVTGPQAQADMSAIASALARQYSEKDGGWGVQLDTLQESLVSDIRPALLILECAVWAVLLIACANVASLLLARGSARGREIALRAALGAGRRRLVRQLLVESLVLAAAGGALGLLAAWLAIRPLAAFAAGALPPGSTVAVDGRVLLHTLAVALATGLLAGLVPAAAAARGELRLALSGGARTATSGGRATLLRHGLVIGEVALALALLAATGLLLGSFLRLRAEPPGFDSRGVVTAALSLPAARYPLAAQQAQFTERLLDQVRALPGVEHAAAVYPLPLSGARIGLTFAIAGRPRTAAADGAAASVVTVTPEYFRTMAIPLLAGRSFTAADRLGAPPVAIVNRALAARHWPGAGESPLGRRITFGKAGDPHAEWLTIVGVVGDVRAASLRQPADPQIYQPQLQQPSTELALVMRAGLPAAGLAAPLRGLLFALDRELPLDEVQPLDAVLGASVAGERAQAFLIGLFGGLALVLAAVGIYGLVSQMVAQRTREIGIRVALGAGRGDVVTMVLRDAMRSVAVGLTLGAGLAWAAGRLVASRLYGVSAGDPVVLGGMALLLTAAALAANWLPARRATRVDPLAAMRGE